MLTISEQIKVLKRLLAAEEDVDEAKKLTAKKAKKMLSDNSAQGHPLTSKQKGLFGLIAGGGRPSKKKR